MNYIFITFGDNGDLFTYPQNISIPRIGETVGIYGEFGVVTDIRHIIQDTFIETTIICKYEQDKSD